MIVSRANKIWSLKCQQSQKSETKLNKVVNNPEFKDFQLYSIRWRILPTDWQLLCNQTTNLLGFTFSVRVWSLFSLVMSNTNGKNKILICQFNRSSI
jgi:hypothetical protein